VLVAACVAASPALGAGAATEAAPLEIQGTLDAVTGVSGQALVTRVIDVPGRRG